MAHKVTKIVVYRAGDTRLEVYTSKKMNPKLWRAIMRLVNLTMEHEMSQEAPQ